ncbi:D-alanyl-D-alanine carboxypeptidase [Paenibacillus sp. NAIST15-1]|nr:D-alanyl-D-alanine carboxypeptidase [Paenibacillus sp. NAIST15-1]
MVEGTFQLVHENAVMLAAYNGHYLYEHGSYIPGRYTWSDYYLVRRSLNTDRSAAFHRTIFL